MDKYKNPMEFKDRLRLAMKDESNYSFSKRAGMSDKVIRDYLSGATTPTLERAKKLAEVLNCPFEWLATGYESRRMRENPELYNSNKAEQFLTISTLKSAQQSLAAELTISREWLIEQGLLDKQLALYTMIGESMSPTINSGALLLVSPLAKSVDPSVYSGLFVIKINNVITVRRLQFDPLKQGYFIKSDNLAFDDSQFIRLADKVSFSILAKVESGLVQLLKR